jgi:hypothetical protein
MPVGNLDNRLIEIPQVMQDDFTVAAERFRQGIDPGNERHDAFVFRLAHGITCLHASAALISEYFMGWLKFYNRYNFCQEFLAIDTDVLLTICRHGNGVVAGWDLTSTTA